MQSKEHNVHAYIVYSEDAHQSEYTPACDKRREFISGFTGSAGVAVILASDAALWTDGRYYAQAEIELDSKYWKLMKAGLPTTPTISQYLIEKLPAGARVGVDSRMASKENYVKLQQELEKSDKHLFLVAVEPNLIDLVWNDKPSRPDTPVFIHEMKYAGKSHADKLNTIRDLLKKENAYALVVSALDEVAWLFNLRGSDVEFNPVFISYAIVTQDNATLYIDEKKITAQVKNHLGEAINVAPYEQVFSDIQKLSQKPQKIWLDPIKGSFALFHSVVDKSLIVEKFSPITYEKALKNPVELEGIRQAHIRDAAALVSFFAWLEERLAAADNTLTEYSVATKLDEFRAQQPDFVSPSFQTISGIGPNGAIIHYRPEEDKSAKIVKEQLYLCDSGGQYKDGTTDVTRTLHFGEPTQHQKECFTRVLKGHIALDAAVFPKGTVGNQLDLLARMHLWSVGLDYRHGTGHGVGAFLNVHEGPQGISFRESPYKAALEPGMTVTDEPGYYEDGNFGIRIENVLVVKESGTPYKFGEKPYYGFEHVTVVPIQTKLIDISLLTHQEIQWINEYHQLCWTKVSPLLQGKALEYLKRETAPIGKWKKTQDVCWMV